jgi:hypothetical protein
MVLGEEPAKQFVSGSGTGSRGTNISQGDVRKLRKNDRIRHDYIPGKAGDKLEERGCIAQESGALAPVNVFARSDCQARELADVDFPNLEPEVGSGQIERLSLHSDELISRQSFDESVAADWAVRDRVAIKCEVSVVMEFLAGGIE